MKRHLIVIDVQNDFCEGGNLAVEGGREAILTINKLTKNGDFDTIIATQDWHPQNHCSFTGWPEHCVKGMVGAAFHPYFDEKPVDLVMRKGTRIDVDSYSAFRENDGTYTNLHRYYVPNIDEDLEQEFYICGIATEVCVKATAIDCADIFGAENVYVIVDACASITKKGEAEAIESMKETGITITEIKGVLNE